MVAAPIHYKDNLLNRIGGDCIFDFLIIAFCERIHEDPSLKKFYGSFDFETLNTLQKEFVMTALIKSDTAENLKTRVILCHYQLFERGLNETHFDTLAQHFSDALHDCWLISEVRELCQKYFMELRPIFQENSKSAMYNAIQSRQAFDNLSLSMRETPAGTSPNSAFEERLTKSESYQLPNESNLSAKQMKTKNKFSLFQKNGRNA